MKERRLLATCLMETHEVATRARIGGHVWYWTWPWRGEFTFSFWALFMLAGSDGNRSKAVSMCCPALKAAYGDGGSSDLALDTAGFAGPYPGSLLYYNNTMDCFRHKPESRNEEQHNKENQVKSIITPQIHRAGRQRRDHQASSQSGLGVGCKPAPAAKSCVD